MIKSRIARFAGIAAGVAVALSFAAPASAQTMSVAQLQAQIAALMAQLQSMSGTTGTSASVTFTRDLTIGSSGSDVTALQNWLISKGFTISAGATGYFGAQTKAALARYQASAGISPAAGYFGPLTRSNVNSMAGGTVGTGGTTTGGTVTTGGTTGGSTGVITTPGVEGVLSVTAGPISNTVLNVGQTMVPVLTVRAQAQTSDIAVQRIIVDLGTNTNIFNKLFSKIYVVDNASGAVLASQNLNSSTVVQNGNDYVVTLSGFSAVVPHGTYKDLGIKVDLYNSIDSAFITGGLTPIVPTFIVPVNGVRGIDGAGIDQYGPSTQISQTVTINRSLTDNAQANVSIAQATPITASVPVTDTTNGLFQQLPVLAFNVNAQNDTLHLHQVTVNFVGIRGGGNTTATATAAYLYNGSTQVASASINSSTGVAVFQNITDGTAGASIPAGSTQTFTVKADVTGVTTGSLALTATLNAAAGSTIIYNSQDSTVTNSGAAVGQTQTVLGKGPAVSLVSSTLGKTTVSSNNSSTSTLSATFNVQLQAVGSDIMFGTQASTSPAFTFGIYKDGALLATDVTIASTSNSTLPTGVTQDATQSFTLSQNQTITLPVTYSFQSNKTTGVALAFGNYAVGIETVRYVANGAAASISTSGQTQWRTSTQVLP